MIRKEISGKSGKKPNPSRFLYPRDWRKIVSIVFNPPSGRIFVLKRSVQSSEYRMHSRSLTLHSAFTSNPAGGFKTASDVTYFYCILNGAKDPEFFSGCKCFHPSSMYYSGSILPVLPVPVPALPPIHGCLSVQKALAPGFPCLQQ
jgi:hypothetical protein